MHTNRYVDMNNVGSIVRLEGRLLICIVNLSNGTCVVFHVVQLCLQQRVREKVGGGGAPDLLYMHDLSKIEYQTGKLKTVPSSKGDIKTLSRCCFDTITVKSTLVRQHTIWTNNQRILKLKQLISNW